MLKCSSCLLLCDKLLQNLVILSSLFYWLTKHSRTFLSSAPCDIGWVCGHLRAQMGQKIQNGLVRLAASTDCEQGAQQGLGTRAPSSHSLWLLYVV